MQEGQSAKAGGNNPSGQAKTSFKIIDMHAHIFPEKIALRAAESIRDYYSLPLDGDGTSDTLIRLADGLDMKYFIVSSAAIKAENVRAANDFIAAKAALPGFAGYGTLHAGAGDVNLAELERFAALGLRGVKLHSDFQGFAIDDERMYGSYAALERLGYPVLFHLGDDNSDLSCAARLRRVLERFPAMKIIAAHMGGYRHREESEKYLIGTPVYLDTSEWDRFLTGEQLCDMIRRHGVERVLYGCDYPLVSPGTAAPALRASGLGDDELALIFAENSARLFGLDLD